MSSMRNIAGRKLGGRYMLLTLIAKGGMGEVWKARDQMTGTLVAAKVLRPELVGEEISLSRLRLEAKNAMRAKHPNIAAVLDSGEDNSQGWIVMELVEGEPLTKYVGDSRRLTAQQLIPILIQTAYALDAAARANVVHRDIKPANILIRPDGMVKLTDFGVSLSHGQANLTAAGMVMGTAQYLPPEQAMGAVATSVGDIYALGVIAFEALAGRRPYTGKSQVDIAFAHVNEEIPLLPADVPSEMAQLVYRLLSKAPNDRPQSGIALARELATVAEQLGLSTEPLSLKVNPVAEMAEAKLEQIQPLATPMEPVVASKASAAVDVDSSSEVELPSVVPPVHHVRRQHLPGPQTNGSSFVGRSPSWRSVTAPNLPTPAPVSPAKSSRTWAPVSGEQNQPAAGESRTGLLVIVVLVVLTLVLIVVAMLRASGDETSSSAAELSTPQIHQEVVNYG